MCDKNRKEMGVRNNRNGEQDFHMQEFQRWSWIEMFKFGWERGFIGKSKFKVGRRKPK